MSSFNSPNPQFDSLLLQTLMGRLQIRPPLPPHQSLPFLDNSPLLSPDSLEQLLLNDLLAGSDSDNEEDDGLPSSPKTQLAKEEARLEKEIIRTILGGKTDALNPNSGQAVMVGEHHICVGFNEDTESDYRVWEWHGHIMMFDEENGYSPEYIYGNYFERLTGKKSLKKKNNGEGAKIGDGGAGKGEKKEDKVTSLGLRDLIDSGSSAPSRILHRNVNAGTTSGHC